MAATTSIGYTVAYDQKGGYVARILGRDPKFIFERQFISNGQHIDEPGLYEARSIDRKGRKDDRYFIVFRRLIGGIAKYEIDREEAVVLARDLDLEKYQKQIQRKRLEILKERLNYLRTLKSDDEEKYDDDQLPVLQHIENAEKEIATIEAFLNSDQESPNPLVSFTDEQLLAECKRRGLISD